MLVSMLSVILSSAEEAAQRAAWEAQRRSAIAADQAGGICIPGSEICDKNLIIALAVVGFLWLSTCGGVASIVALFQRGGSQNASSDTSDKKKSSASASNDEDKEKDEKKQQKKGKEKESGAANASAEKQDTAQQQKQQPNVGMAVIVAVAVLAVLVWSCTSGSLSAAGGPSGDELSAADERMRMRLEAMAQPRGTGAGAAADGAANQAEADDLAANKAFVKAEAEKQAKHDAKRTTTRRAPRAKVEYTFSLSGTALDDTTLATVKAYAEAHSLLGHVFLRGGKVEGRVQGREDHVQAAKLWLEALEGVIAMEWEDALTHPFDKFEIMKMGH